MGFTWCRLWLVKKTLSKHDFQNEIRYVLLGFLVVPQMLDSISVWQYMRLGYDGNIRLNLENVLLHEKRLIVIADQMKMQVLVRQQVPLPHK